MKQQEIESLAKKFILGSATKEERQQLNRWYDAPDDERVVVSSSSEGEKEETRLRIYDELALRIKGNELISHNKVMEKRSRFTFLKIAASILLVLSLTYILYQNIPEPQNEERTIAVVEKSTSSGQRSKIKLPDGTIVRLNAESSLEFPETFDLGIRKVKLLGEAFFEVVKDSKRPFVITSGKLLITVLGTSFDIKAYPGEQEEVWVTSGKVRVDIYSDAKRVAPETNQSQLYLLPNEGVIYDSNENSLRKVRKEELEVSDLAAWKDGWLIFQSKELGEVVNELERWYNVKIIIKDPVLSSKKVTLKHQQNESLKAVMEVLGYLADFEYEINDTTVTIKTNRKENVQKKGNDTASNN